jgi:hypothetical protein
MPLRRKPKQQAPADERRVNALIEKGGTVSHNGKDKAMQSVQIRVPYDLLQRIDSDRSKLSVPPSRHTWILEALFEKLQR